MGGGEEEEVRGEEGGEAGIIRKGGMRSAARERRRRKGQGCQFGYLRAYLISCRGSGLKKYILSVNKSRVLGCSLKVVWIFRR